MGVRGHQVIENLKGNPATDFKSYLEVCLAVRLVGARGALGEYIPDSLPRGHQDARSDLEAGNK